MRSLTLALVVVVVCPLAPETTYRAQAQSPAAERGVVVESVGPPWSGASRASLREGDVIVSWSVPGASEASVRRVDGLHDWMEAEAEHGLRLEGVRVTFRRDGPEQTTDLGGGAWLLTVRPVLADDLARAHAEALAVAATGEQAPAAVAWRELAGRERMRDPAVAAWFALRSGAAALSAQNAAAAEAAYAEAREWARDAGLLWLERDALEGLGRARQAAQKPEAAADAWTAAATLLREARPTSPAYVRAMNALAQFQREFGSLEDSERTYRVAMETARTACPGTIAEVASVGGLSVILRRRGDLSGAERLLSEAAQLLERFPSWHPDRIANVGNRAILSAQLNRLDEAERLMLEAERLDRARGTPPARLALEHHGNLGVLSAQRGDLAKAEVYFRSTVNALGAAAPETLDRVRATLNLAALIAERGELTRALVEFEAGAALAARVAPGSSVHADALLNLGTVRTSAGDEPGGTRAYEEALAIRERSAPDSVEVTVLLSNLARNAERRGRLDAAAALATRAVAHTARVAPASNEATLAYHVSGRVAEARGDRAEARRLQERAIAIARATAPGSRWIVGALAALGRIDAAEGRLEAAAAHYAEAIDALGDTVTRMGAAVDVEAAYVDRANLQRPYVDVLLALGRQREAFEAVERFRARAVLDRLAARDLTFGRTDEAGALARERRALAAAYDGTLAQIARLPVDAPAERVQQLQARLAGIRERQSLAASNLRRVDPEFAERLDPSPVSTAALQAGLAPGTLALVYHLGAERPTVFAVSRSAVRVAALGEPATRLSTRVETWRRLVDRGRTSPGPDPDLDREARALYDALLAPVADDIASANRVVIVPDGVLHGLAFAALRRGDANGPGAYVAGWKPTAVAPSLSALARLSARPHRPAGDRTAVVVGDVRFGEAVADSSDGDRLVRSAVIEGLPPLPGTRREAEDVARAFPARVTLLLGEAASEPAIKRVARDTSILHIATHGVVNDLTPLDSALVLASPGPDEDDNGLLQAWEIFDQVRLDADLVVLSACDTGLGRTFAGEGLLGLTRAFQFAGARAVAASLWKAPDEATAALMSTFYAELARGLAADEALARAEQRLLERPETAHPYYWAAFVVDGDTRP